MGVVDASLVKETIEKYSTLLKEKRVYFKEEIPEEKLKNAIEKYADIPNGETPLLLIDDTILGSGKMGAVFTEKRILCNDEIPYNSIELAEIVDYYIYINNKRSFTVIWVNEQNRLVICNMIREIIGMKPQKSIINGKKLKNLTKRNKNLRRENEYLKKRLVGLQKASYMPPETLVRLKTELHEMEEKCDELESTVKMQNEEIKVVQSKLRAALEKSEKEKSLLQQEVETLHQEVEALKETLQQTKLQIQTALNNLTPEERYIYNYIVGQKGTINIAQLMKIKKYTVDEIFKIFDTLESKGLIDRIVEELNAGRRFTSRD